jgi:hypothetical protein
MSATERGLGLGVFAIAFFLLVLFLVMFVVGLWAIHHWRMRLDADERGARELGDKSSGSI